MIALTLIIFGCGLSAFFLLKNSFSAINDINISGWPGRVVKGFLTIVVTALILVGTICMFIVSLAFAMAPKN